MKLMFVRFGQIPTHSKNYLTGQNEDGVSVYEAIERDGKIQVLMPVLTYSACVSLSGVIDRPAYVVTGTVVGTGSDGEPLLRDCRVVVELGLLTAK